MVGLWGIYCQMNPIDLIQTLDLSDDFIKYNDKIYVNFNKNNPENIHQFEFLVEGKSGLWRVDYSHIAFVEPPNIMAIGVASSTTLAGRNLVCLSSTPPSLTSATGHIMSASAFALLGSSLAESDGQVRVWVKGKVAPIQY